MRDGSNIDVTKKVGGDRTRNWVATVRSTSTVNLDAPVRIFWCFRFSESILQSLLVHVSIFELISNRNTFLVISC